MTPRTECLQVERLGKLEQRADAADKATDNINHFLFGNARDGYVKANDARILRIELIGILLLGMGATALVLLTRGGSKLLLEILGAVARG